MSSESVEPIYIRANAKRNGLTTIIIGVVGLMFSSIWLNVVPEWLFLAGIFMTSASLVALLIGYFKLREPAHSIEISPNSILYFHRRGRWTVPWQDIQRVGCPSVRRGLDHVELEVIGFRLKDYTQFLDGISARLATHLLMEQRPLLFQTDDDKNCASGSCYQQSMFDDKHFVLPDGRKLTGVKAMLANRMRELRDRLGYDVFISASELDRSPAEFVGLLQRCQQARINL